MPKLPFPPKPAPKGAKPAPGKGAPPWKRMADGGKVKKGKC